MTEQDLQAQGFTTWEEGKDPFEDLAGPFYHKDNGDGTHRSAFIAERRHCNGHGALHGGLLMSFADYSLFSIAKKQLDGRCVTVGFNCEFVSAGQPGEMIEATGEITRATRSLLFVRGKIFSGSRVILTFSGILKRLGV